MIVVFLEETLVDCSFYIFCMAEKSEVLSYQFYYDLVRDAISHKIAQIFTSYENQLTIVRPRRADVTKTALDILNTFLFSRDFISKLKM